MRFFILKPINTSKILKRRFSRVDHKVIIHKSGGGISLVEKDTIEYVSWTIIKFSRFFCLHFVQLFSGDATIFLRNFEIFFCPWKQHPQKLLIINPNLFFRYCQPAQNQPKSQFLFHKNCSPRDICIMTLVDYGPFFSVQFSRFKFQDCWIIRLGSTKRPRRCPVTKSPQK